MWWKVLVVAIVVLVFLITIAILYGANRWQSDTRELHAKLEAARLLIVPESYDPRELENLPSPVDETSAKATLKDGETTLTLLFRFNENSLIESVRAEARGRIVAGAVIPTPWEGRWSNYELRYGMRIPIEGEVMWMLPEGPKPYWRGRITRLSYEFAQ